MPKPPQFPIKIFYDGDCSVCAAEIDHYLRQDHGGKLMGVDIRAVDFDPEEYQITLSAFLYELHVIDAGSKIYCGVEAFWAIWQAFPPFTVYGLLGAIVTMPLINPVARLVYKGFAAIRPALPKRDRCKDGSCHIGK